MVWTKAQLKEIQPLTNTIVRVVLEPAEYQDYQAGQYLQLKTGDNLAYFSIANAPLGSRLYELHIRHEKKHQSSQNLLAYLQTDAELALNLPLGQAHIGVFDPLKPFIFIAGGTGFAPIKAIIEYLLHRDDQRSFECYWLTKMRSDLYWQPQLLEWQHQVAKFKYLSLVAGESTEVMLAEIYRRHQPELNSFQFVVSGAFDMVYRCRDQLLAWGVEAKSIFSDAFEFEHQGKL